MGRHDKTGLPNRGLAATEVTNDQPIYDGPSIAFVGLKVDTRFQTCMISLFVKIVFDWASRNRKEHLRASKQFLFLSKKQRIMRPSRMIERRRP
jgi:hypothetical protein